MTLALQNIVKCDIGVASLTVERAHAGWLIATCPARMCARCGLMYCARAKRGKEAGIRLSERARGSVPAKYCQHLHTHVSVRSAPHSQPFYIPLLTWPFFYGERKNRRRRLAGEQFTVGHFTVSIWAVHSPKHACERQPKTRANFLSIRLFPNRVLRFVI
jgi:hypothetical protein